MYSLLCKAGEDVKVTEISLENAMNLFGGASCATCQSATSCPGSGSNPTGCGYNEETRECTGAPISGRGDSNGSVRKCGGNSQYRCTDNFVGATKCFKYDWTCTRTAGPQGVYCKYVSSNESANGSDCVDTSGNL